MPGSPPGRAFPSWTPTTPVIGVTVALAAVTALPAITVRRTAAIPPADTNGIAVMTASPALVPTLALKVGSGRFLDTATGRFPAVVLGAAAARALGVARLTPATQVFLGTPDGPHGTYAAVLGFLAPSPLAPEIDTAALLGEPAATGLAGSDGAPTRVYLRARPDRVPAVRALLARTANPAEPGAVTVGRPSELLIARATAGGSLTVLALGLGGIAILVGAVGVANVMVAATLDRRAEVGLRRALGATRAGIGALFLTESTLLCAIAGVAGALLGVATALTYAAVTAATPVLPALPIAAAVGAALLAGVTAGFYPALRAARIAPTEAVRSM